MGLGKIVGAVREEDTHTQRHRTVQWWAGNWHKAPVQGGSQGRSHFPESACPLQETVNDVLFVMAPC